MKKLKCKSVISLFAICILSLLIATSCSEKEEIETEQENNIDDWSITGSSEVAFNYQHLLWLNFQDSSGNDLLEGIRYSTWEGGEKYYSNSVNPELYTLEYVYEDGFLNPWNLPSQPGIIYDKREPDIRFYKRGGVQIDFPKIKSDYNLMGFITTSYNALDKSDSNFAKKIILRLTCPDLFGDNEPHDIVTRWEMPAWDSSTQAICYSVEYDGKEYTKITSDHIATVIVDR